MNYDDIRKGIEDLIQEAVTTGGGRIGQELEPLKEAMVKARQQGVTLKKLYDLLSKKGFKGSPSSFAKYAQVHLQRPGKLSKPGKQPKAKRETSPQASPKADIISPSDTSPRPASKAKPRVANGDY